MTGTRRDAALVNRALSATFVIYILWLVVLQFAPVETVSPLAPLPVQVVHGKYSPIAIYDPTERELTVTAAAPRETLVCLRGQCKLVEEWIGR